IRDVYASQEAASTSLRSLATSLSLSRVVLYDDLPPTEISTLSLHDALPICQPAAQLSLPAHGLQDQPLHARQRPLRQNARDQGRSEEHTSELQSRENLVCRLLLEKKKKRL